jgi:hypothetical protein
MIKGYVRSKDISLRIQMQPVIYTNVSLKLMELDQFINIDALAYAVQPRKSCNNQHTQNRSFQSTSYIFFLI